MGEPGFWDDPEAAGRVGAEHARLNRRLETFEKLQADADDLDGLVELGPSPRLHHDIDPARRRRRRASHEPETARRRASPRFVGS